MVDFKWTGRRESVTDTDTSTGKKKKSLPTFKHISFCCYFESKATSVCQLCSV